jgi:single-strand DNA-binding protein
MYQKSFLIGNLGKDPEMRFTPSGTPVTSLSIACNRKYRDANEQLVKETVWTRVSAFGKRAEVCAQYLKKGSLVFVEARLTPDKQTGGPRIYTRTDGTPGATFEFFALEVVFLSTRGEHVNVEAAEAGDEPATTDVPTGDDQEIPF